MKPAAALLGIYLLWVVVSCAVYGMHRLWPSIGQLNPFLFPPAVLFFILLGCYVNVLYLIFGEEPLRQKPAIRFGCFLAVVLVAILMYAAARNWGINAPVFYMVYTANLLVFANLLGVWIVTPVKREAELVIVCLAMALADLFSYIRGPTRQFIISLQAYYESGQIGPPPASDFLLIKVPLPGLPHLQPLFGVSDWIIIVFLSAAAARFRINDNLAGKSLAIMRDNRRPSLYFPVAAAGLLIAIAAAEIGERFVPVLPVIAALFVFFLLVRCPAARQLTRADWRLMGIFSAVMLALLGAGLLLTV